MDKKHIDTVNECIVRIKNGDTSAIESLHNAIGVSLRFIAFNYFKSWYAADDVTQEFWLNIENYCLKYRYIGNGFSYLMRVFDNLCREKYNARQGKYSIISLEVINEFEENLVVDPDIDFDRLALRQSFDKAKARMNDDEKLIFAMLLYGEMSVRRIARATGFSKSKTARIRQSCMNILKQTLEDDGWGNDE